MIFEQWQLVEADLHEIYGIDLTEVKNTRSWRWASVRIMGLFSAEHSRLRRTLMPDEKPEPEKTKR